MEDLRLEFEAHVLAWPDISSKYMFGCLAYMVKGKLFAFLDDDYIVITRLDEKSRQTLADEHEAFPFESKGKPVGGWVQVAIQDSQELAEIVPYVHKSFETALLKAQEA